MVGTPSGRLAHGDWLRAIGCGVLLLAGVAMAKDPDAGKDDPEAAARRELREIAERAYDETLALYETGDALASDAYQCSRRLLEQELALAAGAAEKKTATQAHLDRMREVANYGLWRSSEVEYLVTEAELMLEKLEPDPKFVPTIQARKALRGLWEIVSEEEDGAAVKKPELKSLTVQGRRGEFVFRLGAGRALLSIDPTAKPASMDIFGFNEDFPFGGHGIYKLDGDKLTVCWTTTGERPTEFATHAGDNARLCVLRRAGK